MSGEHLGSSCGIEMTSKVVSRGNGYNNSQSEEITRDDSGFPQKRIKGEHKMKIGVMEKLIIDAVKNGETEELESILTDGANPNVVDEKGRTALHWAVCAECTCKLCSTNSEICLKLLLASPKTDMNIQDMNGETALHLAAENQSQGFAELLLAAGADISIKNDLGEEVVSTIARKLPDTMLYLLNESITVDQYEPHNEKCVLQVDFGPVVGHADTNLSVDSLKRQSRTSMSSDEEINPRFQKEMKILTGILHTSKFTSKKILTHPVISIFLEQKWRRVSKFFWMSLIGYVLWVTLYASYIINVYLINCPCRLYMKNITSDTTRLVRNSQVSGDSGNKESDEASLAEKIRCTVVTGLNADVLIIVTLTAIMAIMEISKMIITPKMYLKSLINLGHWFLFGLVFMTTIPNFTSQTVIEPWQYQTAAFAVFLSWALILYQIGRFPSLGRYVEIFGHVLKIFGFFILTYASLFAGFAIALSILFPGNTPFSKFFYAVLKIFVMMAGEVDYQEMFYGDDEVRGPIMGHILYAIFVIVVSIVLMNLLIGLTVSDIQGLQKEAEFARVARLIVEIFHIESFVFSTRLPRPVGNVLKSFISVLQPSSHAKYNLNFTFRPNSPEDTTVPERLKSAALNLAAASYHEQRSQKCSKGRLNRSDNSRLSRVSDGSSSSNSSSSLETHSLDASTVGNPRKTSAAWSR